jgi:hypothetical protein
MESAADVLADLAPAATIETASDADPTRSVRCGGRSPCPAPVVAASSSSRRRDVGRAEAGAPTVRFLGITDGRLVLPSL